MKEYFSVDKTMMLHRFIFVSMFLSAFGIANAQVENISKSELLDAGLPVVEITTVDGELPTCEIVSGKPYDIMGEDSDDIYGYDVDGNKVVNVADIVELTKIIRKTK